MISPGVFSRVESHERPDERVSVGGGGARLPPTVRRKVGSSGGGAPENPGREGSVRLEAQHHIIIQQSS